MLRRCAQQASQNGVWCITGPGKQGPVSLDDDMCLLQKSAYTIQCADVNELTAITVKLSMMFTIVTDTQYLDTKMKTCVKFEESLV